VSQYGRGNFETAQEVAMIQNNRVANLAYLKPDVVIPAFYERLGFFQIKEAKLATFFENF